MKLQIAQPYVEAMVDEFPALAVLKEQLRFGNSIEIPVGRLASNELEFLVGLYRLAGPSMHGRAAQLLTLQRALHDEGHVFQADDLEAVLPAIARYLLAGAIRGWLFHVNVAGKPLAYVVARLDYTPSTNDDTGKVFLELKAHAKASLANVGRRHRWQDGKRSPGRQGLSARDAGADCRLRRHGGTLL